MSKITIYQRLAVNLMILSFLSTGCVNLDALHQAAKNGDAEAQYNLGFKYESGIDVPRDFQQARYWYELSAKQGNHSAQNNLNRPPFLQVNVCTGDCINGQGTYIWANGDKYIGEWKNDRKDGQGTYIWASGEKYTGEWKNDKRDGQGTYIQANGEKYVGKYQNDKPIKGQGTLYAANGSPISNSKINWGDVALFGIGAVIAYKLLTGGSSSDSSYSGNDLRQQEASAEYERRYRENQEKEQAAYRERAKESYDNLIGPAKW